MAVFCYEAFPNDKNIKKMRKILVEKHDFKEKSNQYGSYFYKDVDSMDDWQVKLVMHCHHFKYRKFNKRYDRASNYRNVFFSTHKGPYRCAYCGRSLRNSYIEVDHLIPVGKVKTKTGAMALLWVSGMSNVNDPNNLVASCKKCNRKKSDKMGLWTLRGILGKHKTFWVIRDFLIFALILIIGYASYHYLWPYIQNYL